MKIIKFEEKYRDDMIYMVLSAKNALGRIPKLNEDLLDIQANYLDQKQSFWIAIDEFDRVIGCIGTKIDEENQLFLSRLYVRFDLKRKGIGSKLLKTAEDFARENGYQEIHVHLGIDYLESHSFYTKHGYKEYRELYRRKQL